MSTNATGPANGGAAAGGRSHLAAGSRISGEFEFPGLVELLGTSSGKLRASSIVLEQGGNADGELIAETVAIKGAFDGRIAGGSVRLHSSARMTGEIVYESLSIDAGAEVNAQCSRRPAG